MANTSNISSGFGSKLASVGFVKGLVGAATATDTSGVVRNLQIGDQVFANEVIKTSEGGAVLIAFLSGAFASLGHGDNLVLTPDVFGAEAALAPIEGMTPAQAVAQQADIAAVQAKIAAGFDPTQVTEAAAAGPTAGGAGGGSEGGSSFVVVDQLAAQGEVTSGYPTGPISVALQSPQAELGIPVEELPVVSVAVEVAVAPGINPPTIPDSGSDPSLPYVSGNNAYIPEGTDGPGQFNTVTFLLQLSVPFERDVTVSYEIRAGSATPGADYFDGVLSDSVTIPAGTTSLPITVNIAPDHLDEGSNTFANAESFYIVLTSATNATINPDAATGTGWIVDDDTTPVAVNDTASLSESALDESEVVTINGTVITNDSDADGDVVSVANVPPGGASFVGTYGTLLLNQNGSYTYTANNSPAIQELAEGQSVQDIFTYIATDKYQNSNSATLTITITGTNDVPYITSQPGSGSVQEDMVLSTGGQLLAADVDSGATLTWALANGNAEAVGTYGTFGIDSQGNWTYDLANGTNGVSSLVQNLAAGETQSETFDVVVTDEFGASAPSTVTITITGTNDTPVITAENVLGTGAEKAEPNEGGTLIDNGSMTFADVDLSDDHTITVSTMVGDGSGNIVESPLGSLVIDPTSMADSGTDGNTITWTYSVQDSDLDFLAEGQTLTQVYTVTVDDGKGGIATQDVTVTITGTNDAPYITSQPGAGSVQEDMVLSTGGQLLAADVDSGATLTWALANGNAEAVGTYGTFGIDSQGNWTYDLANGTNGVSSLVQNLATGETQSETFDVVVTDEFGASAPSTVTVTITGTNDAPMVDASVGPTFTEAADAAAQTLNAAGTVNFGDIDNNDLIDIAASYNNDIAWSGGTLSAEQIATLTAGFVATTSDASAPGSTAWTYTANGVNLDFLKPSESIAFSYTVTATDTSNAVASDVVSVTITGTNDAPVVEARAVYMPNDAEQLPGDLVHGWPLKIELPTDVDNASSELSVVITLGEGFQGTLMVGSETVSDGDSLTLNQFQSLTYVPDDDSAGEVSTFSYQAYDGQDYSTAQTVTLTTIAATPYSKEVQIGDAEGQPLNSGTSSKVETTMTFSQADIDKINPDLEGAHVSLVTDFSKQPSSATPDFNLSDLNELSISVTVGGKEFFIVKDGDAGGDSIWQSNDVPSIPNTSNNPSQDSWLVNVDFSDIEASDGTTLLGYLTSNPIEANDSWTFTYYDNTGGNNQARYVAGEFVFGEEGTVPDMVVIGQEDIANTMWGSTGGDVLTGGDMEDLIAGGEGNDTLAGGEGADTFVFQPNGGNDTVTDFDPAEDVLHISDVLVSAGLISPDDAADGSALYAALDDLINNGSSSFGLTTASADDGASTQIVMVNGSETTPIVTLEGLAFTEPNALLDQLLGASPEDSQLR